MKLVDRYIARHVFTYTAVVLFVLVAIYFFSSLVDAMGDVGKGRFTAVDAVTISVMMVPRYAYELFPMVALLGTLLGLGALATTSELTVLRASGVSIGRIAYATSKAGLVMVLVMVILGEVVAPQLEKEANDHRLKALSQGISIKAGEGMWARDGDNVISIHRIMADGQFAGLSLYRLDGQQVSEIATARSARLRNGKLLLEDVSRTTFDHGQVHVARLDRDEWKSHLTPEVMSVATLPPENLSAYELYDYVRYLHKNALAAQRYELAMWMRVMAPFSTAGMVLLALPFVFGSLRSGGFGQRIMVGAMIGIGFYMFDGVFSRMGIVYDISPFVSAAVPTLVVYALWYLLMRRVH